MAFSLFRASVRAPADPRRAPGVSSRDRSVHLTRIDRILRCSSHLNGPSTRPSIPLVSSSVRPVSGDIVIALSEGIRGGSIK